MLAVLYATSNNQKFIQAQAVCQSFDITLSQSSLEVPEIQSETGETIAQDKAAKAFAKFQHPVIISDDSWSIPGLQGFPGPYMKYINDWFAIQDWLNLTKPLQDRRIILRQIVAYQDANSQQLFFCDLEGVLLTESRGKSSYLHSTITSFDGGKHTNAEFHELGTSATAHLPNVWHQFAKWYTEHHATV